MSHMTQNPMVERLSAMKFTMFVIIDLKPAKEGLYLSKSFSEVWELSRVVIPIVTMWDG